MIPAPARAAEDEDDFWIKTIREITRNVDEKIKKDTQIRDVYHYTEVAGTIVINESKWRTPEVSYRMHIWKSSKEEELWFDLVRYGRTDPVIKSHDLEEVLNELYRRVGIRQIQWRLFE